MNFLNKYGWLFCIIAMAGDLAVSFILSMFYKGYSSARMSISALGNPVSPVRVPFNAWMILEGLLFLSAIPAVYNEYDCVSGVAAKLLAVFIAAFAIGACIFTGFFSVNESKDVVTTASKIHGAGSAIGFMLFLFVPLILAILSFKSSESFTGVFSIICFILSLVFFVMFIMSDKPEFKNTFIDYEGSWQRLNLIFMYLPLVVISVKRFSAKA